MNSKLALQQYITERIALLDPSIDTSPGSRLQSIVITPLLNRLGTDPLSTDIQSFITQRLHDEFPQIDIDSPGNSWQDVLVAPLIMLLEPLRREISFLRTQLSLGDTASLNQNELDALIANVFSNRNQGEFAFATCRVFFSSARTIGVDGAISFSTLSGIQFVCDSAKIYLPSDMVRSGNLWYIDVLVHSVEPLGTAIAAGAINTVTGIDGVVKCTNLKPAGGGQTTETGDAFVLRAGQSLTERSLNSARAIETFITDNITGVVSVGVVGFGEPEMKRDIIKMNGTGWATGDTVTLSSIPGGVPFPGVLGTTATIPNNEVHIGGMTDVYVKTTAPVTDSIDFYATSADTASTTNVLVTGIDGSIDATKTSTFSSPTLVIWLANNYDINNLPVNLVVEIVNPPTGMPAPTAFRILDFIQNNDLRIDAAFSTFVGTLSTLQWRLVKNTVVSLNSPHIVSQQGTELVTLQNQMLVTIPSGIAIVPDPATSALFLGITTGSDIGEYRISSKTATQLLLTTALTTAATGVHYNIFSKQSGGVSLPLIQVKTAILGGLGTGVAIPYRYPVATALSSVAGFNGTVHTVTDLSAMTFINNGASPATLDNGAGLVMTGGVVNVNDVVYISDAPTADQYFYVTGVAAHVLTLDRAATGGGFTTSLFKIGAPAVGDATILFRDPTYLKLTKSSVISYTASDNTVYKFRPSPGVSGFKYYPAMNLISDFVVGADTDDLITHTNIFALGVVAGDTLSVVSRVLRSARFTDAAWATGLTINGQVLTVGVDGTARSVQFTGTDPISPALIVARINQVLGDYLFAEAVASGSAKLIAGADHNEIRIHSAHKVTVSNTTARTTLKFNTTDFAGSSSSNNQLANGIVADYPVAAPTDNNDTTVTLTATGLTLGVATDILCVRVKTKGSQYFYPNDMALQANGMYAVVAKMTSYDPFDTDVIPVDAEATLVAATYESLGYDLIVDNACYSYSTGEKVDFRSTAIVLDKTATDMSSVYCIPTATVTVEYDYAPEVSDTQNFLLRQSTRIVNNNPLARHFLPAYPVFAIQYSGSEDSVVTQTKVTDFLKTLYPNKTLEVFDLLRVLSQLAIDDVVGPVEVAFLTMSDTRAQALVRSKNSVTLAKIFHVMGELYYVTITRG